MTKNDKFDNLLNFTNNPEIQNLLGNFVKVVNTNLENSINQDSTDEINQCSNDESSEEESLEEETNKMLDKDIKNQEMISILKELFIDKNGNNIADILSDISNNIAKNNQILNSIISP